MRPFDDLFAESATSRQQVSVARRHGASHFRRRLALDDPVWQSLRVAQHQSERRLDARPAQVPETRRHHARAGVQEIVSRYPDDCSAFGWSQTAVRPYIGTGRLQFSCKRAVGERYFITPQAYGSVDALYSRGMISTFEMIYTFAQRLLDALSDDDFAVEAL